MPASLLELAEAENERYPLLERVNFLSISASNLDEFYMVRVAGLKGQQQAGIVTVSQDGLTPVQQLDAIYQRTHKLMQGQQIAWLALRCKLAEQGIEPEKLMVALEDALLSAYKKQPGSAKYARVEMDRDTADFRVIELIIPERLEAHLIVETIDEETAIDPETGEMREPEEPEIDPKKFAEYRDQIDERDVTPDDFGRIAAQTAKQVILQRIREA